MTALALALILTQPPADPFAKWEKEVVAIEAKHAAQKPAPGGVVFAGSSSIRLWDLKKSFPDVPAVNAGFGGSHIADCTHFAPRLVVPHKPKTIIFYAGDNDIGAGKSPKQVADDFAAFVAVIHKELPKATIHFIAVKPSTKRWTLYGKQTEANALVKAAAAKDPRLGYVDIVPLMLGTDGKPDPALLREDGLHMTPKGYEGWAKAVAPLVK